MELGGDTVIARLDTQVRDRWSARTLVGLVGVALIVTAGCSTAGSGASPATPRPSSPSSSAGPRSTSPNTREWIAVLRVAADPSDLDAETARLAPALGSAFRASPAQCFRGLPADAGTGYVLGVVATTKSELRSLVSRSGLAPLFVTRAEELCID
ncbi:MAG: hypothetical protein M3O98_08080 [Actinomycetota bacterium]|nr:hypothetical protein [Actinomycetota bacterium]